MKQLFLLLLLFPMLLQAQIEAKYDEGAVPVVNGKVTFTREIDLPGQTKEQVYSSALKWASDYFVPEKELQN